MQTYVYTELVIQALETTSRRAFPNKRFGKLPVGTCDENSEVSLAEGKTGTSAIPAPSVYTTNNHSAAARRVYAHL